MVSARRARGECGTRWEKARRRLPCVPFITDPRLNCSKGAWFKRILNTKDVITLSDAVYAWLDNDFDDRILYATFTSQLVTAIADAFSRLIAFVDSKIADPSSEEQQLLWRHFRSAIISQLTSLELSRLQ